MSWQMWRICCGLGANEAPLLCRQAGDCEAVKRGAPSSFTLVFCRENIQTPGKRRPQFFCLAAAERPCVQMSGFAQLQNVPVNALGLPRVDSV